jgi:YHS domain-containing protein
MKSTFLLPTLLLLALSFSASAQQNYTNVDKNFIGLGGYDPVSYFTQDRPSKGKENLTANHNGATYQFSNQSNLDTFSADPDKYAPAYGGYCAYAMGKGYLADANPETYKIKDGKLLVFYNNLIVNTLNRWNKDEANLYVAAEENWESKVAFED